MKVLILSHFNNWYGPKIFLKAPESMEDIDLESIPDLMDLYEVGFFAHSFKELKSVNLLFEISSEYGRGNRELLLISILTDKSNEINLNLSQDILERFSQELKGIKNAYKAFYLDSDVYEGSKTKYEEIKKLFFTFYEYFPKESILLKRPEAKIFIYGLSKAGKTTIVKDLQNSVNKQPTPTTDVSISRIFINNMSVMTYDAPGQGKLKDLWKPHLKNQDALVFVVDITDKERFTEAADFLHSVANMHDMSKLPLLLLFNKIDLMEIEKEYLATKLKVDELQNPEYKIYLTSGLTGEGIEDAFNWLSLRLRNEDKSKETIEVGLIFSKWDEDEGVQIVSTFPDNEFEDPDLLAIKCFSISQFVFGDDKFRKVSFILPFTNINANASIHFDWIPDEEIRGGQLPLALIVFFNEKIPRAIIRQINNFIFKQFDKIKQQFDDKFKIKLSFRSIHDALLKKINSLQPSVQALRLAELRYQALFKAATDAILILDRDTSIVIDANEQAEKLFLMEDREIIGRHASQIGFIEDYSQIRKSIIGQIKTENAPPINMVILNSNNKKIPVEVNANEIQIGGQNIIQCIVRDITERKRSEEALKDALSKYKDAYNSANFYRDLFTHDMNNILNNIQSSIELFSLYINNPYRLGEIKDISEIIKDQVIRGANLVKNVRKLSKIDDIQMKLNSTSVDDVLDAAIQSIYKKFAEKNIDIEINSPKEKFMVLANEYLYDVFECLILNAIKYNENRQIIVQIMIKRTIIDEKPYIQLEFIDNGIGIPEHRKDIVFEGQYEREKGGRAMDIGLSLVKIILEKFGGKIWIEDKVKTDYRKGCVFIVLIPGI
jgi:PAS domain S-box-containing protein/small GTP-binding protein